MKLIFYVFLSTLVNTLAAKGKKVHVNPETVLESDKENVDDAKVKTIDNVQSSPDNVKNESDHREERESDTIAQEFRRNFNVEEQEATFTDFLEHILEVLVRFKDENLEEITLIFDDEMRKYHYKGCKFYELVQNPNLRTFISEVLERLRRTDSQKLKKLLKGMIIRLQKKEYNEKDWHMVNFVNSLYKVDSTEKMYNVLKKIEELTTYENRTRHDIRKIVRYAIRTMIFDHYSNLQPNARKDLRIKMDKILLEFLSNVKYFGNDEHTTITIEDTTPKSFRVKRTRKKVKRILKIDVSTAYKNDEQPVAEDIKKKKSDKKISEVDEGITTEENKKTRKRTKVTVEYSARPYRDLEKEEVNMPSEHNSFYPKATPKTKNAPTKRKRKRSSVKKHSPSSQRVLEDKRQTGPSLRTKRRKLVKPNTVREDFPRPPSEIWTKQPPMIRPQPALPPLPNDLVLQERKNDSTLQNSAVNYKPKLVDTSIAELIKRTKPPLIKIEINKSPVRKRRIRTKTTGLPIEPFENNKLTYHYTYRRYNKNEPDYTTTPLEKGRRRKPTKSRRTGDIFYEIQRRSLAHHFRSEDTPNEHIKIESTEIKNPFYVSKEQTTTINSANSQVNVSDSYIIEKINKLEKQLERVIHKIDDSTTTKSTTRIHKFKTTTTKTNSETEPAFSSKIVPPKDETYDDEETTTKYPIIPFWKGTSKTMKVVIPRSSSFEKAETSNDTVAQVKSEAKTASVSTTRSTDTSDSHALDKVHNTVDNNVKNHDKYANHFKASTKNIDNGTTAFKDKEEIIKTQSDTITNKALNDLDKMFNAVSEKIGNEENKTKVSQTQNKLPSKDGRKIFDQSPSRATVMITNEGKVFANTDNMDNKDKKQQTKQAMTENTGEIYLKLTNETRPTITESNKSTTKFELSTKSNANPSKNFVKANKNDISADPKDNNSEEKTSPLKSTSNRDEITFPNKLSMMTDESNISKSTRTTSRRTIEYFVPKNKDDPFDIDEKEWLKKREMSDTLYNLA